MTDKYSISYEPVTPNAKLGSFLWGIIRRNPIMWVLFLISDVVHHIRHPLSLLVVGFVIDSLVDFVPGTPIPNHIWIMASLVLVILCIGELAHGLTSAVLIKWFGWMRPQIRADFLHYTLQHSYQYFQDNFSGSLMRKITEATESTLRLQDTIRYNIFAPIISFTSTALIAGYLHPLYGVVVLIFIFSVLFPILINLKRLYHLSKVYSNSRASVTGQVVDSLSNALSVKSFANIALEIERHNDLSASEIKGWMKFLRKLIQIEYYRRTSLFLFSGIMMLLVVYGIQIDIISIGEAASIMGMAFGMTGHVWTISAGLLQSVEHLGYVSDALNVIVTPHKVKDQDQGKKLDVSQSHIVFSNINLSFTDQPVFKGLNIDIKPNEHIGLIGHSGAGKSTLINLLLRFFDVDSGEILIDGQNIAGVTQNSLRQNIAVIPQDTSLFHRSLMDNIRYGRLDATDEEVIEAAKKAHAHEFISGLSEGYETMVGERGIKLSGGQRQRIAIARAILKDAPILILDEATSALDSESEKLIQESLHELMEGKTVIAIAHRLSTIADMNRLIVMDQGQIVEDGSHKSLLKKDGLYAKLWNMQSGGFLGE